MEHTGKYNKVEFIHDPDFVEWVLHPTIESDQYWETYLAENPSRKKEVEQAGFLIRGLVRDKKSLTDDEVSTLWDKIKQTNISGTRNIRLTRWSIAAGILLIIGFSGWLTLQNSTHKIKEIDYKAIAAVPVPGNDIKLILSDRTEKTFATKEVEIKYNNEGQLETKAGKQVQTEELNKNSEAGQVNQLVVPPGRRSSVVLADGTKLWLNSGSRAIYPVSFNGKTREIYVEGEGYLEVAHDQSKAFWVVTDLVKVKVLGTKFDISAYKDDDRVSVVLVEGSVQASAGIETIMMKPNQLFNYEKLTQKSTLEKADIHEYVSWVDGWMFCHKEQIKSVVTKLSRYYGIKMNYTDLRLNSMTLTGKLDLKNDVEEVLKAICTTAPLKYELTDNSVHLTIRNSTNH